MSLKPLKRSDEKKGWNRPRRDDARRIRISYQLIVTEGTKTEPYYFKGLQEAINRSEGRDKVVLAIEGSGKNTIWLMDRAKELVKNTPNPYSDVWLVYDRDDFPAERVNEVAELCKSESNEETKYHAIWSNPCIELWYLLHFCYFHSDIDRKAYFPKLSEQLHEPYAKNRKDMFSRLLPKLGNAIANAEKLDRENRGKTPTEAAPGTQMHRMMKTFRPYLGEQF